MLQKQVAVHVQDLDLAKQASEKCKLQFKKVLKITFKTILLLIKIIMIILKSIGRVNYNTITVNF